MYVTNEQQAERAFAVVKAALDELEWNYEAEKDEFVLETGIKGEDLPIPIFVRVRANDLAVVVMSPVDIEVTEETAPTLMIALCMVNDSLAVGNFDYHASNQTVWFRISTYFRESELSISAVKYLLYATATCVDQYNDKLLLLMNGLMTLDELNAFICED